MARDLLDSDISESEDGGASLQNGAFRVNEEFAKRFEHNKKREELQQLEEKFGASSKKRKRDDERPHGQHSSSDESSSESDDEGEFATEALDHEIMATLNAIRSKDPRVYDTTSTFYTPIDESSIVTDTKSFKEKSMHLRDYHRQNLLNGKLQEEEDVEEPPLSYNQEQARLKKTILDEINAAAENSADESSDDENQAFLVTKRKHKVEPLPELDVEDADKNPDTFLSNFMTSRAWVPQRSSQLHPFESDDEDDERRAEEYEEAYNFRFEDPAKSNEKLRSHARDIAARYSVRREEGTGRKKKRETEKEKKETEKQVLKEEKARLRKLKIEELAEKVQRIKRAAGMRAEEIGPEDWSQLVDEDWDDDQWDREMAARFGDNYYAEQETVSDEEMGTGEIAMPNSSKSKKKHKKPRFDEEIDITDIVPDFQEHELDTFSLSGEEREVSEPRRDSKSRRKANEDKKKSAKKERKLIEQLIDDQMKMGLLSTPKASGFRYRDTSPTSFGMSARDILLANDSQLNEFAGLKKLAAFRDTEKKRKDQKHLGKRARLRKWRKETFGDEEGLQNAELVPSAAQSTNINDSDAESGGVNIRESGKKKRRRGKKQKLVA